jgi:hypothetical protein
MKEGIRIFVTNRPLSNPKANPTASEHNRIRGNGNEVLVSNQATTIPHKVMFPPTERSMPPEILTKATPMHKIMSIEPCLSMLTRLLKVRKVGSPNVKNTTITISTQITGGAC